MLRVFRYYRQVAIMFVTEPLLQALLLAALAVLGIGTVFYHLVEGWGWLDSVYFCTVTLATIGYGDFVPTTAAGKLFTIFYVVFGLGIITTFITAVARANAARPHRGVAAGAGRCRPLPEMATGTESSL